MIVEGPQLPVAYVPDHGHVIELEDRVQPPHGWVEVTWEKARLAVHPKSACPTCIGRGRMITRKGTRYCECVARRIRAYIGRNSKASPAPLMRRTGPLNRNERLQQRIAELEAIVGAHDAQIAPLQKRAHAQINELEAHIEKQEQWIKGEENERAMLRVLAGNLQRDKETLVRRVQDLEKEIEVLLERAARPIEDSRLVAAIKAHGAAKDAWGEHLTDPPKIRRARTQLKRLKERLQKRTAPTGAGAVQPG